MSIERSPKRRYPTLYRHLAARFDAGEAFGLHLTLGVLAMLGAGWVFGQFASDVVDGAALTLFDLQLASWFHRHREPGWTTLMLFITHWHQQAGILAMALLLALYLRARQAAYWLLALVLAVPGGMLMNVLLKYTFQRPRPRMDEAVVTLATYSFPSGHASGATLFYGLLAAYIVCSAPGHGARIGALAFTLLIVALVALSRVYLGAHYLSDVLAGMAFALAWLAVCITAVSTLRRTHGRMV